MKKWMLQNKGYITGAILGGLAGFIYWKYVGCLNGTCAITSRPLNSTLYFAFLGAILLGSFKTKEKGNTSKKAEP